MIKMTIKKPRGLLTKLLAICRQDTIVRCAIGAAKPFFEMRLNRHYFDSGLY